MSLPRALRRATLSTVVVANGKAKLLAIRLTKWTGKSPEYVHPKHLRADTEDNYWYLAYLRPDMTLLDVGCGNGMHTIKAAQRCRQVVGIDASEPSLGVGRRQAAAAGLTNLGFLAANVEKGLPVQAERFDLVLCLDLLEHVHARDLVLAEIRRVLRADGTLLLGVPNRGTSWKRRLERAGLFFYSDPDHKIEYTRGELEAELDKNGFRIVRLHPNVYDTPLIGLIDVLGSLSLTLYERLTALRHRLARRYPEENSGFYALCVKR